MKNSKKIVIIVIVLIILGIVGGVFIVNKGSKNVDNKENNLDNIQKGNKKENLINELKNKKKEVIGKYVSNKSFVEKGVYSFTGGTLKSEEDVLSSIGAKLSIICGNYDNVYDLVKSFPFKELKKKIDKEKEFFKNKEKLLYVMLPDLVYQYCTKGKETNYGTFQEYLLRYLQNDTLEEVLIDEKNITDYISIVKNVKFESDGIDIKKLKSSKEYFHKVFFEDNLTKIKIIYFSESMVNINSPKKFLYTTSIYNFEESNLVLEEGISNFQNFLKKLGFSDLNEFRKLLLKNTGNSDLDGLKKSLISNYKKLVLYSKAKGIKLNVELLNKSNMLDFYNGDFSKIKNNEKLNGLFKSVGEGYLFFSIINDDYAENLDEGWSGKQFFGDNLIGNGIIKVGFLYILDTK